MAGLLHRGADFCLSSISVALCGWPVRVGKIAECGRTENVNNLRDMQWSKKQLIDSSLGEASIPEIEKS